MMNFKSLPDTNVWLYQAATHFREHKAAVEWFAGVTDRAPACFCRATQLSFLRLLTQREAMKEQTCTQRQAWEQYDRVASQPGVTFLAEPPALDQVLRSLSTRDEVSPKRWADDYLAAFATAAGLTLVTFDSALASRLPSAVLLTP